MAEFLTYKGLPLVRKGKDIYYGDASEEYVVYMQIKKTEEIENHPIATKVIVKKMLTDRSLPPTEIFKNSVERTNLYDALDVAYAWLSKLKR